MTKNFTQNRMKKLSAIVSGGKMRTAAFLVALMLSTSLFAQTLVNVLPNTTSTSGNGRAPQGTRLFINTMYIILPSEMTTSGYGADNITSVGWTWNNPLAAGPTTQSIATTGNVKIWVQSTTDVIYSKGTTFSTAGMTKIYDGNITIPATAAQINIDLPVGGPGTSIFTTVAGEGVYVAFEYQTTTTLATPIGAPTVSCNSAVVGSAATYQSQTANGTTMTLTAFRPETRFGTVNSDIIQVQNIYMLGTAAALFGNPQPLQAIIKNVSAVSQSFNVDFTILEKATLTVRHSSSIPVILGAGLTATVDDLGWNATLNELDTAIVTITPLPGETITANNTKGYRHNVTADSYNYSDLSASSGGVGYATGEGLILNKYHIEGCTNVKQVRVYMGDANSTFNIVYAVVMDASGVIVGQSADYTIMPIDIGGYVTFDILTPPNFTDADYYVGLAQTANIVLGYFPVGTQSEPFPARSNAYYATGLAGGIPAMYTTLGRFMIEGVITPLSTTPTTSGDVSICLGESTDLSVTDGILNPYATYNWYTDGCGTTLVGTGSTISVSPGAPTTYYVRAEDPCNGVNTACGSLTVSVEIPTLWYADADGDTYGDAGTSTLACDAPGGYVADLTDCDDGNSAVNPGATEVCNAIDDDCAGGVDDGLTFSTWYADGDGDTYGDAGTSVLTCDGAPVGYVADATDCNDETAAVNPGATEVCNTIDDNCDGNTDEGLISAMITTPEPAQFCNGGSVMLNAATDPSYSYQWYRNGLPIPGATASSYNANFAGNYAIMISVAPSCAELSAELTVTKIASPTAVITNMDGTNDLCIDASIKLKANGGGGLTYQWYKGPTLLVGATSNVYYATTPGGYKVITTYTATGCSKLSATTSIIQTCREEAESMEESISVYPNPTSGSFTLDMNIGNSNSEVAYINVYNLVGDVVYTTTTSINNGVIQELISMEASAGVYLVKVTTDGSDREYNTKVVMTK